MFQKIRFFDFSEIRLLVRLAPSCILYDHVCQDFVDFGQMLRTKTKKAPIEKFCTPKIIVCTLQILCLSCLHTFGIYFCSKLTMKKLCFKKSDFSILQKFVFWGAWLLHILYDHVCQYFVEFWQML